MTNQQQSNQGGQGTPPVRPPANADSSTRHNKRPAQGKPSLKLLVTTASIAAVIGGWGAIAHQADLTSAQANDDTLVAAVSAVVPTETPTTAIESLLQAAATTVPAAAT